MDTDNTPDLPGWNDASNREVLRLQIEEFNYALHNEELDDDTRAAIRCQIQDLQDLNNDDRNWEPNEVQIGAGALEEAANAPQTHDMNLTPAPEPPQEQPANATVTTECTICVEQHRPEDNVTMPCGHIYCKPCVRSLVMDSLQDESLWPPRCCVPVPRSIIATVLDNRALRKYEAKKIELDTKVPNRVYCCNPECARFLGPKPKYHSISRRVCQACGIGTCTRCTGPAHAEGQDYHTDCVAGEKDQTFIEAVRAAGYQQCPDCHRFVELTFGCYHMTCLCGFEFCYLCAARWRTCRCPQWAEARLYERAAQIVNRNPGARRMGARRHRRQVNDMAEYLREHHDCEHEGQWKQIKRRLKCEDCGQQRRSILKCRRCHLQACQRCSMNRRPQKTAS